MKKKEESAIEQLGTEHGAMLRRFLVKIFGETGATIMGFIIFLAVLAYIFRNHLFKGLANLI